MGLNTGQTIVQGDFINQAQRDATPANDANKAPKNEADGRLSPWFTRNGAILLAGETLNGATLPVPVWQSKVDNELYACDANDNTRYKFIGFVTSNSTNGNPITFQGSGIVSGFTGLQEGEKYYVQDAVGTIGTTPGTQHILVGVAISETQLLIQKAPLRASGGSILSAVTASGTIVVTCGFRPNVVRLNAIAAQGGSYSCVMAAVWANDAINAASVGASASNAAILQDGGANLQFTITSVTDTGFTITYTENGTFAVDLASLLWEAEGEL
jgi:hypothetical protein